MRIYHRGFWILIPCIIGRCRRIGNMTSRSLRVKVLVPCLRLECMQLVPSAFAVKNEQIAGNNRCVPLMSVLGIILESKTLNALPNTEPREAMIESITKLSVELCAGKV